jgi:L-lactate dehydrogenase (cytochrome)/(S)-mandelate dehydrogenase
MRIEKAINYDDLRDMARRRLPRIMFDFIEGGVDGEQGLTRNLDAFQNWALVPKYMVDVADVDSSTTLFGRTYSHPFGIAPTGAAGLFRTGADMMLARAAKAANIPFIMSGAATATIEELGKVAPQHGWYQLYMARDRNIADDMIRRAEAQGFPALVLTVDVPAMAKRERNLRNGFSRPLKPTLSSKLEALAHPGWLMEYFTVTRHRHIVPNWAPYAKSGASPHEVADFFSGQTRNSSSWDDIARIRKLWPRTFIIKGIMHPEDARRAAALGVDGIMVSNHGARQLDRAPSPIEVLPAIRDAVGDKVTVMLDSGVRRGADIVTALAMGAKFVFVGRWTLYGVAAGAEAGANHAVAMIANEVRGVMTQMGAPTIDTIGPDFLFWDNPEDLRRNRRP